MNCVTCNADIPPSYVNAIKTNICPGCGGSIMELEEKELMDELASAMARMPNDPQGLAGWLLSNYKFKKIGTAEPVDIFYSQKQNKNEPKQQTTAEKSTYNEFLNRTGQQEKIEQSKQNIQKLLNKNSKYQELAKHIMEDEEQIEDGIEEDLNDEDLEEYEKLKKEGIDPFKDHGISAVSKKELNNISQSIEDALKESNEGRDLLNKMINKRIKAEETIKSGGGAFRRS